VIANTSTLTDSLDERIDDHIYDTSARFNDVSEYFDDRMIDLKNDINAVIANTSMLDASTNERIDDLRGDVNTYVSDLSTRIETKYGSAISYADTLDAATNTRIDDLNIEIDTKINSVIANTSTLDANMLARVNTLRSDVSNAMAADKSELNSRIESVISNTSTLNASTNERIDEVESGLNASINAVITNTSTLYASTNEKIDNLESGLNASINTVITDTDAKLGNLETDLRDLISLTDASCIIRIDAVIANTSTMVENSDARTDALRADVSALDVSNRAKFGQIDTYIMNNDASITGINRRLDVIDLSIGDLYGKVTTIITDPSILSLFSKDIYTVNLCCYTEGGYVIIADEKEPIGQYKTYVDGDRVKFTAVANLGYKFKKWMRNAADYTTDSSINLVFNDSDINVNGLLPTDGIEILKNGYSAIFAQLYTVSTKCVVTTPNAEQFNDSIQVFGAIKHKYFDDGTDIRLQALAQQHHDFEYFMINGIKVAASDYTLISPNRNVDAIAYFSERRYTIVGEADPMEGGDVTYTYRDERGYPYSGMVDNEVIEGTKVILTAQPAPNYHFKRWVYGQGEAKEGQTYPVQDTVITIIASETCPKHLKAEFEVNQPV